MQCGGDAARIFRVAAQPPHFRLQLADKLCALLRVAEKERLQLRILDAFRSGLKTVLSVSACLNQIVERRDCVVVIYSH
jgi:hypothetical protein